MAEITVLNPVATVDEYESKPLVAVDAFSSRHMVVLDNTKPNAAALMERVAHNMREAFPGLSYSVERKTSSSQGASAEQLHRIGRRADLVVTGSGD